MTDSWVTYARRMGALCVLLEHRYYGKSLPTKDVSTDNLRFLSGRQALQDTINFQRYLRCKLKLFRNKWVVFGGSYAGNLAAWLRLKFPKLFHSAVAYSAPVYIKANFPEYLEVVNEALLRFGGSECVDATRNASQTWMEMLNDETYYPNITEDFKLCEPLDINGVYEKTFFVDTLLNPIAEIVQYNRERPFHEDEKDYDFNEPVAKSQVTLNYFCSVMTEKSLGSPYQRYAFFIRKSLQAITLSCLDVNYDDVISEMRDPHWNGTAASGARQWTYQICTEFGYFQTTDSEHQPFSGVPLSFFIDLCQKIFDMELTAQSLYKTVQEANNYYGDFNSTGSRILFPNGSLDPWHALSINSQLKEDVIGFKVNDSSHCEVMYDHMFNDSRGLRSARHFIFKTLNKWLNGKVVKN
ncbi:putative serine protease K12H4.7 [Gracilinanus agilis]|uniref:putative serine protease K12H4.7 n=1 Tax=Gracilinanus agilis TaxID=191870 RepID=UPI001CFF12F1|nr:putative serine protease K12H4.7 [Gracilinanus agilis]